jgi:hypothetical protein
MTYLRIIFLIIISYQLPLNAHELNDNTYYQVKFDYQNYPKEREKLYRYYLQDYDYDPHDPCSEAHPFQKTDIGIDFYDINNDGVKEILVYLNNPCFCGAQGCHFDLFKTSHKNLVEYEPIRWNSPQDNYTVGLVINDDIRILKSRTLNFCDISFSGVIWQWNGFYYNTNSKIPSD